MNNPSDMENASVGRVDPSKLNSTSQEQSKPDQTNQSDKSDKNKGDEESVNTKPGKSSDKSDDSDDHSSSNEKSLHKSDTSSNGGLAGNDKSVDDLDEQATVPKDEKAEKKQRESLKQAFKRGASMVPPVATAGIIAKLFHSLQSFLLGMLQAAMALGSAIGGVISGVVSAVVGFISTVATAIGVGFTAAAAIVGGVSVTAVVAVVMCAVMVINSATLVKDDSGVTGKPNCSTEVVDAVEDLDVDAQTLEYAKKVYSCLHELGMPDINIAAVLGNFSVESGFDPTTIEGLYGSSYKYNMNSEKMKIVTDSDIMERHCQDLFSQYSRNGVSCNPDAYLSGKKHICGIGMVQWTGGGAKKIMDKAASLNCDWWDFDFQMAYIISQPAPTGNSAFKGGIASWTEPATDIETAALYFSAKYEGNTTNGQTARVDKAEKYYKLIVEEWSLSPVEKAGNAILGFIKKLGNLVDKTFASRESSKCTMTDKVSISDTGNGIFGYPTDSRRVTASFPTYPSGREHSGIDFGVPSGSNVYAAADGEVVVSKDLTSSYGRYIIIKHDNDTYTLYAHNTKRLVEAGDKVVRGEKIALSGSTGNSTGPHCHFEVRTPDNLYSCCVDPEPYLAEEPEDTGKEAA